MTGETTAPTPTTGESALAVFRNRAFLRLWLSQAATQIGGNMVLYGLTVIVVESTGLKTVVSLLILTFLVPAVLFSAVAGVYVDRIDRRLILIATNVLRGAAFVALYLVGTNLALILLLNFAISTITVFFAPAEAAMIPFVVERRQLLAANGIFTLTLNASFALGFALLGPLVVNLASPQAVIIVVAGLYFLAAVFCFTLPSSPPTSGAEAATRGAVGETEEAVESTFAQLREGLSFIRGHHRVFWSLMYLGITASLVGVLGVLGPGFAKETLGLGAKDFAVVVLPLGFGIVTGILLLNAYGHLLPRRRVIEGGLICLGVLLALLAVSGPISRLLQRADAPGGLDLSGVTSLLAVVVAIALLAGIAYAFVAIPAQTQLQEDLPEDVRGPRLRHPEHARLGGQLRADHHRRADLRRGRHDRGPRDGRGDGPGDRDRVGDDPGAALVDGRPQREGSAHRRPDRRGARRGSAVVERDRGGRAALDDRPGRDGRRRRDDRRRRGDRHGRAGARARRLRRPTGAPGRAAPR